MGGLEGERKEAEMRSSLAWLPVFKPCLTLRGGKFTRFLYIILISGTANHFFTIQLHSFCSWSAGGAYPENYLNYEPAQRVLSTAV